eukprot:scaffold255368_cov18-Prasinocladus_malaysianus.AAC.1
MANGTLSHCQAQEKEGCLQGWMFVQRDMATKRVIHRLDPGGGQGSPKSARALGVHHMRNATKDARHEAAYPGRPLASRGLFVGVAQGWGFLTGASVAFSAGWSGGTMLRFCGE